MPAAARDSTPTPGGRRWEIAIPGWHPARLNELLAGRWASHRLKKRDREFVAAYARLAAVPVATGRRRVRLLVVLAPRQRGADPDAYQKSLGDALKHAGMLVDDNRQGVEWAPVVYDRGPRKRSVIGLEDIAPLPREHRQRPTARTDATSPGSSDVAARRPRRRATRPGCGLDDPAGA